MSKYKPQFLSFDEEAYQIDKLKGDEKADILLSAIQWVEQYIDLPSEELEEFSKSFTRYFEEKYYKANKSKIQLDVKIEKLLDLVGINLMPLRVWEQEYQLNDSQIEFNAEEGSFRCHVDEEKYKRYTKSADENKRLRDATAFIEALEKITSHTKVYPLAIQQATCNFITYNVRENKYRVDI